MIQDKLKKAEAPQDKYTLPYLSPKIATIVANASCWSPKKKDIRNGVLFSFTASHLVN